MLRLSGASAAGGFGGGQFDYESRADRLLSSARISAVVFGDDAAGDGQAEAGAAVLGGEVREEKFVFVFGGDAVAAVGDSISTVSFCAKARGDREAAEFGVFHGFGGVVD